MTLSKATYSVRSVESNEAVHMCLYGLHIIIIIYIDAIVC